MAIMKTILDSCTKQKKLCHSSQRVSKKLLYSLEHVCLIDLGKIVGLEEGQGFHK